MLFRSEVLWMWLRMTEAAMCAVCALMNIVRIRLEMPWWRHEFRPCSGRAIARAMFERPRLWRMLGKCLGVLTALGTHVDGTFVVMEWIRCAC